MPSNPRRRGADSGGRQVGQQELSLLRKRWKRQGKTVAFTNGVFDVIHRGHVELLQEARASADVLVVGLNSDTSVRRLKGPSRPVNRQSDRAAVLAALRSVDYICLFKTDTPLRLIESLRPDVLVKGAEYAVDQIVGAELVRSWGGKVMQVKMRRGYSTTSVLKRASSRRG